MRVNRYNLEHYLFEKQLSIIGKTIKDALENPNWRNEWGIPTEDLENFKKESVPLIKKTLKINRTKAEGVLDWFLITYKLKEI